jgi:hypothetical protein
MFVSIKEAFGGEVAFTKEFAKNKSYQQSLFDTIGFIYDAEDENLSVIPEDPIPGGRIDDMVYYDGEPKLVIECQDTKGTLDILHATKITAYMYHKGVTDGVVICEDYDQWLVDMVREKFVDRIFIVRPTIVQIDKNSTPLVKFDLIYKPEGFESKTRRIAKTNIQSATSDNVDDPIFTISRITNKKGNIKIHPTKKDSTRIRNRRMNNSIEGIETIKYHCFSNKSDSYARNLESIDDIVKVEVLWQGDNENEYKIKQKELK